MWVMVMVWAMAGSEKMKRKWEVGEREVWEWKNKKKKWYCKYGTKRGEGSGNCERG